MSVFRDPLQRKQRLFKGLQIDSISLGKNRGIISNPGVKISTDNRFSSGMGLLNLLYKIGKTFPFLFQTARPRWKININRIRGMSKIICTASAILQSSNLLIKPDLMCSATKMASPAIGRPLLLCLQAGSWKVWNPAI